MRKLTASNLITLLQQLNKAIIFNYVNPSNKGLIKVVSVKRPEGPIQIKRWNPTKGETEANADIISLSTEMIWRVASSIVENKPFNIDKILGASFNTRSVLESLLAHTPPFYYCYPGRVETVNGRSTIEKGHKHLLWLPDSPHANNVICKKDTDIVISEIPSQEVIYDAIVVSAETTIQDIDLQRRHSQMQVALYLIGRQLNFKTWIARNDHGITYQQKRLVEFDGIISSLRDENIVIQKYPEAIEAALLIDCIWFRNAKLMPAVIEVEHSTGIVSGLTRMMNFKNSFIDLKNVRYVIVAPDEDRSKVIKHANKEQFQGLDVRFFSYSAVEELTALCQKRKIRGVTEEFLDCYMEKMVGQE